MIYDISDVNWSINMSEPQNRGYEDRQFLHKKFIYFSLCLRPYSSRGRGGEKYFIAKMHMLYCQERAPFPVNLSSFLNLNAFRIWKKIKNSRSEIGPQRFSQRYLEENKNYIFPLAVACTWNILSKTSKADAICRQNHLNINLPDRLRWTNIKFKNSNASGDCELWLRPANVEEFKQCNAKGNSNCNNVIPPRLKWRFHYRDGCIFCIHYAVLTAN